MNSFYFHLDSPLFLGLRVGCMTLERTGHSELAKFVADHVFRNINRDVLTAVVNSDRQTDEVRENRRTTRPGLNRLLVTRSCGSFNLLQQVSVAERTFFSRTCHCLLLSACDGAERSLSLCACCYGCDIPWPGFPTG